MKAEILILALAVAWAPPNGARAQTNRERLAEIRKQIARAEVFDFGKVRAEDAVEHTFQLTNPGKELLEIKDVQLTPPLVISKMSSVAVTVRLGQPRQPGDFEGLIVVNFTDANAANALFRVCGRIVRPIDFDPMAAFFITTFKGEPKQQSIEITNYESAPLEILKIENGSDRFNTDLATLEPGRRHRLTVTVKDSAAPGKASEVIQLRTSSPLFPVIRVPVNTQVRDRVYTFPDSITLGLIDPADLKKRPQDLPFLSQSVMVYRRGGQGFQIAAETDIPFLRLTTRQAQLKDRFEVQVEVVPEKLKTGRIAGSLRIATNDPAFPRLEIPVTGQVSGDWQP